MSYYSPDRPRPILLIIRRVVTRDLVWHTYVSVRWGHLNGTQSKSEYGASVLALKTHTIVIALGWKGLHRTLVVQDSTAASVQKKKSHARFVSSTASTRPLNIEH